VAKWRGILCIGENVGLRRDAPCCTYTVFGFYCNMQLAFDKTSYGCTLLTGTREKTLEILPDDLVKKLVLRLVTSVFDGMVPERDRVKGAARWISNTLSAQGMSRNYRVIYLKSKVVEAAGIEPASE
jgi:hypothetical protein